MIRIPDESLLKYVLSFITRYDAFLFKCLHYGLESDPKILRFLGGVVFFRILGDDEERNLFRPRQILGFAVKIVSCGGFESVV